MSAHEKDAQANPDDCDHPEIRAQFPEGKCSKEQKRKCHGHD